MNRDEIITKAAQAMVKVHDPAHAPIDGTWHVRATSMYAARFRTGLDTVEDDIRRDQRSADLAWLRKQADDQYATGQHATAHIIRNIADALERRPIQSEE